ncbi:MAG TPA: hemolysin family protein [Thermoanaerobaculia bacterium]|jgi:CBS domain containing-hemolysin-like protein|nr:hemolysin family protein [Thermoanaerobaculia bacterium]
MTAKNLLFLVLFALSLGLSAFFAGAETALVSLSRIDLQSLREKGDRRAAILRNLKAHTSRLLATILIGQNLFMTAASSLATALATAWVGEAYGLPAAIIFSTLALFIFAEMTPKAIAAASPVAISRAVAVPMAWTMRVLSPIVNVLVRISTGMLRAFGVPEKTPALTEAEMKSFFNLGAEEGVIHGEERKLLHNVLEFGDKTVREIMVPRTKVVALPETARFDDVRLVLKEHQFSRVPVYRGTLDNVVGILNAKNLFDLSDEEERNFSLDRYLDSPFLVPEFKRAEDLFREMRRRRTHMAIVVDEHGGTAGIATIEDVVEELLGEIQDETDEEETPGYVAAGERTYLLEGGFRLDDIEEQFGLSFPRDEAETIAGHLMLRFGRIPRKGERWKGRRAEFIVEDATPTAIRSVRMILPPPPTTPPAA